MIKRQLFFMALIFICTCAVFAQRVPGENLTLKIAVVGPGDQLYFWWGHIALVIEDSRTGQSNFFDYGLFSFENDDFFYNFAFGRLLYSCGVSPTQRNLDVYRKTNRDVVFYTLDLPPEARIRVRDFAEINTLPENRDYFYHHFNDNCSTRIRDIIDYATDGQFKEQFAKQESRFTFRGQVRRHTWFSPAADWFLNFLMGQVIDTPITAWEDMFLPSEVGKYIEDFYYREKNGVRRKLVSSVETIITSKGRPAVLDKPLVQWPYELAFSLVLSCLFSLFFFLYYKGKKAGRVLAGISMSLSSLFFGFAGLLLYFMSLFTNHDYTFQNFNMIYCTPLLIAGVPLGICYALTKNEKKLFVCDQMLRLIWLLVVIGIFISMAIKLLPMFYQDNLTDMMLMLPVALVFTLQPVGLKKALQKWGLYGR
ncbi:MAG: DUF4105 domain-containing protein [Treponema sp.]|nr:DUF4105 domain-containing protein [Treponema sp.]